MAHKCVGHCTHHVGTTPAGDHVHFTHHHNKAELSFSKNKNGSDRHSASDFPSDDSALHYAKSITGHTFKDPRDA